MLRYQKQISLSEIGLQGQQAICASRVLVVGAGGLGCPALQYLVAMGVGHIGVIDGDVVSEDNLHRQILFSANDIGKNKAECVKSYFLNRNEYTKIQIYPFYLDKSSAISLFKDYDVIVDGTDNFSVKMLINDVCLLHRKPMVYGSISQYDGQLAVFWRDHGPCYRCLVPEIPKAKIRNCAEAGVLGALPGVIGNLQAFEVIKIILRLKDNVTPLNPLTSTLLTFNFFNQEFRTRQLSVRTNCLCNQKELREAHIVDLALPAPQLSAEAVILDVRELNEWNDFHRTSSFHWPLSQIEVGYLPEELRQVKLVAACRSGQRAERAATLLKNHGYNIQYWRGNVCGN